MSRNDMMLKFPIKGNINFSNFKEKEMYTLEQNQQFKDVVENILGFISDRRVWINGIKITNHNNLGFSNFIQIENNGNNLFMEYQIDSKRYNDTRLSPKLKYEQLYSFTILKETVEKEDNGFVIEDIISTFQSPIYSYMYSIMMNIEYNVDFKKPLFVMNTILFTYNEDSELNNRFTLELVTKDVVGIRTLLNEHYSLLNKYIC